MEITVDIMRHTMRRHSFKKFASIGIAAFVSFPIAFVIQKAMGWVTPGTLASIHLFPETGSDFMRNLIVAICVDSAICFALILGLYSLCAKVWRMRFPPRNQA
jgi:hypothetical protein